MKTNLAIAGNVIAFPRAEPEKVELSDKTIKALALPPGKSDHVWWDTVIPGYGLRIRKSGAKSLVLWYRAGGKVPKKWTIGPWPAMKEADARVKARNGYAASASEGNDPASVKRTNKDHAADTWSAVAKRYLAEREIDVKNRTLGSGSYDEIERHLTVNLAGLDDKRFDLVTTGEISEELNKCGRKVTKRNRTLSSAVAFYNWVIGEGVFKKPILNAASYCNKKKEATRERALEPDELKAVWDATEKHGGNDPTGTNDGDYRDIVRLLILTGARKTEIGGLEPRECKFKDGRLDHLDLPAVSPVTGARRTKNGKPFVIPVSEPVRAILEPRLKRCGNRKWVFGSGENGGYSGWSKAKKAIDKILGALANGAWVLHDCRRTFSTYANSDAVGIAPHIVEECLNHISGGVKSGVAGVYNRHRYFKEKKEAFAAWAAYLMKAVA